MGVDDNVDDSTPLKSVNVEFGTEEKPVTTPAPPSYDAVQTPDKAVGGMYDNGTTQPMLVQQPMMVTQQPMMQMVQQPMQQPMMQQPMMQQPMMQQPMMQQPMMQQPLAQATTVQQLSCGHCRSIMGIPPGTQPGAHMQCPTCHKLVMVPGGPKGAVVVNPGRNGDEDGTNAQCLTCAGLCCSLIWLYVYWKYRNSRSEEARKYATWSLRLFIFVTICEISYFIYVQVAYGSGRRRSGSYYY